jgi:hypothetical protein
MVYGDEVQVVRQTLKDVEPEREDDWTVFFRGNEAILRIRDEHVQSLELLAQPEQGSRRTHRHRQLTPRCRGVRPPPNGLTSRIAPSKTQLGFALAAAVRAALDAPPRRMRAPDQRLCAGSAWSEERAPAEAALGRQDDYMPTSTRKGPSGGHLRWAESSRLRYPLRAST